MSMNNSLPTENQLKLAKYCWGFWCSKVGKEGRPQKFQLQTTPCLEEPLPYKVLNRKDPVLEWREACIVPNLGYGFGKVTITCCWSHFGDEANTPYSSHGLIGNAGVDLFGSKHGLPDDLQILYFHGHFCYRNGGTKSNAALGGVLHERQGLPRE